MERLRLGKSVQSVVQLQKDSTGGGYTPVVIYKKVGRKKKKSSQGLRIVERAVRNLANAQQAFASSYLSRHNQSNQKEKDGWIPDLAQNVWRARRTGARKLKLKQLIPV